MLIIPYTLGGTSFMTYKKLVPETIELIKNYSEIVENFGRDNFHFFLHECIEENVESPIEQYFYCALKVLQKLNFIDEYNHKTFNGLGISPQYKIGNYRVDFFICYKKKKESKYIIVECDSQEFHERTEQERRYEKKRDRYLQSKDLKIFNFTGKEIKYNPFKVAAEVLSFLTEIKEENLLDYIYIAG